jgi:hypothetical protein
MPTKTKTHKPHPHTKPFVILIIVLSLLSLGLIANAMVTTYLLKKDQKQDNQRVAGLILDAVNQLNQPLTKDTSGKQFIPEAKLRLPPADEELGGVVYRYDASGDGMTESLQLASERSIRGASYLLRNAEQGTVEDVFDSVPRLQSCARGVQIVFAPQPKQTYQATKKLANGKTAYFFMEDGCKNDKLFEFAKQLESY